MTTRNGHADADARAIMLFSRSPAAQEAIKAANAEATLKRRGILQRLRSLERDAQVRLPKPRAESRERAKASDELRSRRPI
jgi:hypothetical protein